MLGPMFLSFVLAQPSASRFEFHDADSHDGRSTLFFRAAQFGKAPVRPLTFAKTPPADARYGLISFGAENGSGLAFVWIPNAPGGAQLWLDANNDDRVGAEECHVLSGTQLDLSADLTMGEVTRRRTINFRSSPVTGSLTYAVRGYASGSLKIGGKTCRAVLTDGNGDGCFHGAGADRVWIDLDGDGQFDALSEQFLLGSPISKAGQVYIVRSNAAASEVRAQPRAQALGAARLRLTDKPTLGASNVEIQLLSDIGEFVTIHDLKNSVTMPTGKYRIASLSFELARADRKTWTYRFGGSAKAILTVEPGVTAELTLLGELALKVGISPKREARPGDDVDVAPNLINSMGLFLTYCAATDTPPCTADIQLVSPQAQSVDRATSGFN